MIGGHGLTHRSESLMDLIFPRKHRGAWGIGGLAVAFVAAVLWVSPASPVALGRADAHLSRGEPAEAARGYDAIAVHSPFHGARQEALYRSALVHALDLGDTETARKRLHRLVELGGPLRAADAWEQIGHLRLEEGQPRAAGRAFRNAWEVAPRAGRAAERLQWAARARSEAGDLRAAERIWRELGEGYRRYAGSALLARAELLLGENDPQGALALYEQAVDSLTDPHLLAVARLGSAACLERLGDLDGALAAIEYGDLPSDVLQARRQGLRTRSALSNGDL